MSKLTLLLKDGSEVSIPNSISFSSSEMVGIHLETIRAAHSNKNGGEILGYWLDGKLFRIGGYYFGGRFFTESIEEVSKKSEIYN